ncbi:MAG: ABC transporter permease [Clostridia bacterium]|nr:ABC transporter permease [Clostridia bacterium]
MQAFLKKLKSMLKVDFKRMFTMPLVYIMAGVSFAMPILILVMTTMMGGEGEAAAEGFTNVWQSIGSVSGGAMGMDLTSMCNINMLYFLVAVLVCVFVADDFRSGYAKNLFTVRSKKVDYVASKSLVTFVGATIMFVAYFIGAMIGGAIAGLPFATEGFGAGGIVACMLSKIFMTAIFVSIGVLLGTVAKQKLWLSILGSFAAGMLLFTMIPMISPLDSSIINVIMCFAGGALFAVGLGAVSNVILNKTSLV